MTQTKKKSLIHKLIYLLIIAAVVAGDQWSKVWVRASFAAEGDTVTVIPGLLDFTYLLNEGATAGMLKNHPWVFMTFSVLLIAGFGIYLALAKDVSPWLGVSLAFVLGGGIGNMIDRIAFGKVTDFLNVTAVDFFPFNCIFNVADVFICVGTALLFVVVVAEEIAAYVKKKGEDNNSADGEPDAENGAETETENANDAEEKNDSSESGETDGN